MTSTESKLDPAGVETNTLVDTISDETWNHDARADNVNVVDTDPLDDAATLAPADNGLVERPERVQAAFDVFKGKGDTGLNATALFEYIEQIEADRTAQAAEIERFKAEAERLQVALSVTELERRQAVEAMQAAEARSAALEALLDKAVDALERVSRVAKDKSDKAWFRLESMADEADYTLTAIQEARHAD